jgi:hypothetical protein
MTNPSVSQRERSQQNPLNLGTFDRTSLRLLKGTLGPKSQIIQGGYGNDTYNNWFRLRITQEAWLILIKAGTKLTTTNVSPPDVFNQTTTRFAVGVYDMNLNPIEGRIIHQEPEAYWGHVAGAASDLYNTYNPKDFDKDNELFYPLQPGDYMFCVSATRNELFNYSLGLVVEIENREDDFILTEDSIISFVLQEDFNTTAAGQTFIELPQFIDQNYTLDENSAYTPDFSLIPSGLFVQVNEINTITSGDLTWVIGPNFPAGTQAEDKIILDATENWADTIHSHSLFEWKEAWERDHSFDDKFPSGVFAPYAQEQ